MDVAGGQDIGGFLDKPGIGAFGFDQVCDGVDRDGVNDRNAGLATVEDRDSYSPRALSRNAPVRAVSDHRFDAVLALTRDPSHFLDAVEHSSAEPLVFETQEPLLGGAEDDGLTVALGVGVAVMVIADAEEVCCFLKSFDHHRVAVLVKDTFKFSSLVGENTSFINRVRDAKVVLLASEEVVASVARGGVHDASSVLGRDVVCHYCEARSVKDWVFELNLIKVDAFEGFDGGVLGPADFLGDFGDEVLEDDVVIVADLDDVVVELGMEGAGKVCGDRPWSRGPDDGVNII